MNYNVCLKNKLGQNTFAFCPRFFETDVNSNWKKMFWNLEPTGKVRKKIKSSELHRPITFSIHTFESYRPN